MARASKQLIYPAGTQALEALASGETLALEIQKAEGEKVKRGSRNRQRAARLKLKNGQAQGENHDKRR